MRTKNRFEWITWMALLSSGLAGCSGADAVSESATGSEQQDLASRKICAGASEGECAPPPTFCGGIAAIPCAEGQTCVDDPNDDCDAKHGGSDCSGICVDDAKPPVCGGIVGASCPNGQVCVDDPSDNCDPKRGGSDCSGICIYARRTW